MLPILIVFAIVLSIDYNVNQKELIILENDLYEHSAE